MMEMLQEWLLGLTAAALAVSLLTAMLPKGETIRRIAGLAGGLILLLAVVQPLLRVRWEELTWRYETYQREMDRQTEAYQAAYADSLSGDIADRTAAYISEKAASLGIDCRVQVMLSLKTGPTLQLAQDMDLEQEEGSLRQRSQPVTVNRGSGWQEALVTRQDYPVYQGAVVVCQGAGSSAVRLAVTEAVAALTGLSTEKITVVQWEQ